MNTLRIGLLGGTFDPVHTGHLQLARAALEECGLQRVLFIPSASPPHKVGTPITPFSHRMAMLELACRRDPRFAASGIEENLASPSYTIDTLRILGDTFPVDSNFFFIIGVDAFLEFTTWKSWSEILRLVNIVIALRCGFDLAQLTGFLQAIGYSPQGQVWQRDGHGKQIHLLQTVPGQFSSTDIRRKISEGDLPAGDVPQEVLTYITRHRLYRPDPDSNRHGLDP